MRRVCERTARSAPALILLLGVGIGTAAAQSRIDEGRAAARDGTVKITNPAGAVRVVGWWRDSVEVSGVPGEEVADLELAVDERATRIRVVLRDEYRDRRVGGSDLEVRVPQGSHVAVRTREGAIEIAGVSGAVDAESETGDVRIRDRPRFIYARSVGGDLEITGISKVIRASSVAGRVTVEGAAGYVEISTVSGDIRLAGRDLWEGRVSSVSGAIRFEGDFEESGSFAFESNTGSIELALDPAMRADLDVRTFAGRVESEFGGGSGSAGSMPAGSRHEVAFSLNGGGTRIEVQTFKGPIRIRRAN